MKRKVLSVLLASAMVVSLAACGGEEASTSGESSSVSSAAGTEAAGTEAAGTEAAEEGSGYVLETLNMVVNGTLTATVDAGQAEFEAQWEEAVGEAIGHPIDLQIQQLDHSGYVDAVGRLFAGGDYPDVIIMSADMFKQYAPTGLLGIWLRHMKTLTSVPSDSARHQ